MFEGAHFKGGEAEIGVPYLRRYASRKGELELRAQGKYQKVLFHVISTYTGSFFVGGICHLMWPTWVVGTFATRGRKTWTGVTQKTGAYS